MKTFTAKFALAAAVAAILGTAAHATEAKMPDYAGYRSAVDRSIEVNDSFNRKVEVTKNTETNVDNSKRTAVDVETNTAIDNSRKANDSYNTSVDNSRKAVDSYNTTTTDSFKSYYDMTYKNQVAKQDVKSAQSVQTLDTQTASNSGYQSGATQYGSQGGFSLGSVGAESSSTYPSGYKGEGGGLALIFSNDERAITQSNSAIVEGANNGSISNMNMANQGRDLVLGNNRSVVGSDLGNKQVISAGDQTQLQGNTQSKTSATQSTASSQTSTSAGQ